MEVPNDKGGETIRYLQYNSGAKIQITRDADANPQSTTRPVEIIGTLSNIKKAEKLINAVIAEADAGGSPSPVARGLPSAQTSGVGEQLEMQVPNEKVGLIISRGGDAIKALRAKSGARIQLIPQHLPEGDGAKERTVRVTGDRKQIEMAREMIKDVTNQHLFLYLKEGCVIVFCGNESYLLDTWEVVVLMNDSFQGHLNALRKIIYAIQEVGCHDLFMMKVPISNWLTLKMQIWLLPFPWGQHCFLGVGIDNHHSLSSTEEGYQALNLAIAGC
ncbi:uncharacterized protein LOC131174431 isoform X2 [Hevea brasiliensis]|uniref:uncharacterized protein LOC131174431 isoform X2 n=1 Tax=Hevea brasiliensis TaxID=3981 RepID=UPI0025EFACFA|nr:uncharacterized protein LOC131174431 isoform X2 [Hevea brasiliensis]